MVKSFLETLLDGAKKLTEGQGAAELADKAKDTWNSQSTLTKGAIAGGLLGVLLSGSARRLVGTGVKVGGAALIGGLAYKAYEDWKSGKVAGADNLVALPEPSDSFLPTDQRAADDLAQRLLQAMIAASKADGHVTAAERARIAEHLPKLGLGEAAQSMIAAELNAPLDFNRIAALATSEEEAVEVYAASLLAVDPESAAEKSYLAMLAARLKLDPGLVSHLHAKAASLA
ncbi:MAG: hypothetical protein ACD_54C00908G0004 [uncultured bacterium]|nr:MAG: hypothetical protein ACD_54C00908G0004 [uncultured bacterium]